MLYSARWYINAIILFLIHRSNLMYLFFSVQSLGTVPHISQRKTGMGTVLPGTMKDAVKAVRNGVPLREAVRLHGIARSTLQNNVRKALQGDVELRPNYRHSQVFSVQQEAELAEYMLKCAKMFHGLTTTNCRKLAYEVAVANQLSYPSSWHDAECAGKKWQMGFLRRNQQLSLRQPEATSLARATAFNRHSVGTFFNLLQALYGDLGVSGAQVFNLDETGITTVHKVPKVIGPRGAKQLGLITSAERGELVTMCCVVGATGQCLPPVYIFPRKNFKVHMLKGAPEGSLGLAHSSGWMTGDNFLKVIGHIVSNIRPSREHPIILIMDNHESHINYTALEMAKENHIFTSSPSLPTLPTKRNHWIGVFSLQSPHF